MMGAGRMVIGLATVAVAAVILKKNKESIWMWMLDKKEDMASNLNEKVTPWMWLLKCIKKMQDEKKNRMKDQEEKKKKKIKRFWLPPSRSALCDILHRKSQRRLVLHREYVNLAHNLALQSTSTCAPKKFIDSHQAHEESSEFIGEILSDLWPNILSRLPVKSIARFRCVCKQWFSLTYDPAFRELHCKSAPERKPHTIFVPQWVTTSELPVYELGPGDGRITEYSPPILLMPFRYCISNPVNGLVVAYPMSSTSEHYYLLNPATREQSSLPASKHPCGTLGFRVGFGFDASTGKYKLIRLIPRDYSYYCSCEVLTVGTLEWRFIGETPCRVDLNGHTVFLNGSVYWITVSSEHPAICVLSLLAFDIKDEKFQRISSLHLSRYAPLHRFSLHQFRGRIFLAESPCLPSKPLLRIWTLKDDGESHEWKVECNVDLSPHSNEITSDAIHLLDVKHGKLLMQQSVPIYSAIYSYDLQSKALQESYLLSGSEPADHLYSMAESFISPKSLTDTSTV